MCSGATWSDACSLATSVDGEVRDHVEDAVVAQHAAGDARVRAQMCPAFMAATSAPLRRSVREPRTCGTMTTRKPCARELARRRAAR